jgi:hypothetical protein
MRRPSLESDAELLANIKSRLPELAKVLSEVNSHWVYEDLVYRFYHQSLKVYDIQGVTQRVVELLWSLAAHRCGAESNV